MCIILAERHLYLKLWDTASSLHPGSSDDTLSLLSDKSVAVLVKLHHVLGSADGDDVGIADGWVDTDGPSLGREVGQ